MRGNLTVLIMVLVLNYMKCSKWPDPFKDEVAYVDNPIESGFPGHWLPLSVIKKMMEMRVLTLATETSVIQPQKEPPTMKLKLHVTRKTKIVGPKTSKLDISEAKQLTKLPFPSTFFSTLSASDKTVGLDKNTVTYSNITQKSTSMRELETIEGNTESLTEKAVSTTSTDFATTAVHTTQSTIKSTSISTVFSMSSTVDSSTTLLTTPVPSTELTSPSTLGTTSSSTTSTILTTTASTTPRTTTTKSLSTTHPTTKTTTTPKPTTTEITTETGNPFY